MVTLWRRARSALNSEALSAAEQAEALAEQAQDKRLVGQAQGLSPLFETCTKSGTLGQPNQQISPET
jgi:hypothetical protein